MNAQSRIDRFVSEVGRVFHAPPASISITRKETDMTEYDNTNRGALFKNDDKDPNDDRDRDYLGTLNVEGKDFWLSGWRKTSKNGRTYLSISVKPKDAPAADKSKPRRDDPDDDEIPF
jgi:hypothetical protein